MKHIYIAIAIGILMGTLFFPQVKAVGFSSIQGQVTDNSTGYAIVNQSIYFKESTTGQTIVKTTDYSGNYSLQMNEFTQGWSYGDTVTATIQRAGYVPYCIGLILFGGWPSNPYICDVHLNQFTHNILSKPYVDYISSVKYTDNGLATINLNVYWTYTNNHVIDIPSQNPAYNGIELCAACQDQDSCSWGSNGVSYHVYLHDHLKIEYTLLQQTLYEQTNNIDYIINYGGSQTIDPIHQAEITKANSNGRDLFITHGISYSIYYIYQGQEYYYMTGSTSDTEHLFYVWL